MSIPTSGTPVPAAVPTAPVYVKPTRYQQYFTTDGRNGTGIHDPKLPGGPEATAATTVPPAAVATATTAKKTFSLPSFGKKAAVEAPSPEELAAAEAKKVEGEKKAKTETTEKVCRKAIESKIKTLVSGSVFGTTAETFRVVIGRSTTGGVETLTFDPKKESKISELLSVAITNIAIKKANLNESGASEEAKYLEALASITEEELTASVATYINEYTGSYLLSKGFFTSGKRDTVMEALTALSPKVLARAKTMPASALGTYLTKAKDADRLAEEEKAVRLPKAKEAMVKAVAALEADLTGSAIPARAVFDLKKEGIRNAALKAEKLNIDKYKAESDLLINAEGEKLLQKIEREGLGRAGKLSSDITKALTEYSTSFAAIQDKAATASNGSLVLVAAEKYAALKTVFNNTKAMIVAENPAKEAEIVWDDTKVLETMTSLEELQDEFIQKMKEKETAARRLLATDLAGFDAAVKENADKTAIEVANKTIAAKNALNALKGIAPIPLLTVPSASVGGVEEHKEPGTLAKLWNGVVAVGNSAVSYMPTSRTGKGLLFGAVGLTALGIAAYRNPAILTSVGGYVGSGISAVQTAFTTTPVVEKVAPKVVEKVAPKAAEAASYLTWESASKVAGFVGNYVPEFVKNYLPQSTLATAGTGAVVGVVAGPKVGLSRKTGALAGATVGAGIANPSYVTAMVSYLGSFIFKAK